MWKLWKNRNNLIFEGVRFLSIDSVQKIKEDIHEWSSSQVTERRFETNNLEDRNKNKRRWNLPPKSWLKYNFASS